MKFSPSFRIMGNNYPSLFANVKDEPIMIIQIEKRVTNPSSRSLVCHDTELQSSAFVQYHFSGGKIKTTKEFSSGIQEENPTGTILKGI